MSGPYQGAPISHMMDVLADAQDLLAELGIRFESRTRNEAAAAAMLAASVHYPIRGAVTFKGPVGVNVAADVLANLSSAGVTGGALVVAGQDYGEGSSIMQERTQAFAMKSQFWQLLDPRPNLPSIVKAVARRLRAVRGVEHAGDADRPHPVWPWHGQLCLPATRSSRRCRSRRPIAEPRSDFQPHRALPPHLLTSRSRKR